MTADDRAWRKFTIVAGGFGLGVFAAIAAALVLSGLGSDPILVPSLFVGLIATALSIWLLARSEAARQRVATFFAIVIGPT